MDVERVENELDVVVWRDRAEMPAPFRMMKTRVVETGL
jgi:hypothetical protein